MFCCTADIQGFVKVWAFSPEIKTVHAYAYKTGVFAVHWSKRNDKILYIGTGNSRIKVINISQRRISNELVHSKDDMYIVAIESNVSGTAVVTSAVLPVTDYCELFVWDTKTYRIVRSLEITPTSSPILSCNFNHNGNLLVCGAADGMIRIYDMAEFQCIMGWQSDGYKPISTVRFSADENTVFSYCEGFISQWRLYPMSQCLFSVNVNKQMSDRANNNSNKEQNTESIFQTSPKFVLDIDGKYLLTTRGSQGVLYAISDGFSEDTILPSHGGRITSVDWHVPYSTRLCLCATAAGFTRITELIMN